MADVIGPCSTLPGKHHTLPKGQMCDDHPETPAVARIQGETDSMGAELNDFCQVCLDEHREAMKEPVSGDCEWCKNPSDDLVQRRDPEEGCAGRLYEVCRGCACRD